MLQVCEISVILENPSVSQQPFNEIVSHYKHFVKGRMGLPLDEHDIAVISLVVIAEAKTITEFVKEIETVKDASVTVNMCKKTFSA